MVCFKYASSIVQDLWNLYWIFSILPLAQGLNLKAIKTLEVSGIRLNLLGLSLKGFDCRHWEVNPFGSRNQGGQMCQIYQDKYSFFCIYEIFLRGSRFLEKTYFS
jgi:hypothetical protein